MRATEWGALAALAVMLIMFFGVSGGWHNLSFTWAEIRERNMHFDWSQFWGFNPLMASLGTGLLIGLLVRFLILLRSARCKALDTSPVGGTGDSKRRSPQLGYLPLTPSGADSRIAGVKSDVLDVFIRCSDLAYKHSQGMPVKDDENDLASCMQRFISLTHGELLAWLKAGEPAATLAGHGEPARYDELLKLLEDYYGEFGDFPAFMRAETPSDEIHHRHENDPALRRRKLHEFICLRHGEFLAWLNAGGPSAAIAENDRDDQCHLLFRALMLHYGKNMEFLSWLHAGKFASTKAEIENALQGGPLQQALDYCVEMCGKCFSWLFRKPHASEIAGSAADEPAGMSLKAIAKRIAEEDKYYLWLTSGRRAKEFDESDECGENNRRALWKLLMDLNDKQRGYLDYYASALIPSHLPRIESRLRWYNNRNLNDLLDDGWRINAFSIDETLQDLLQQMTERFSITAMVKSGLLAVTGDGNFEPPLALLRDAPIYPHYDQDGRPVALSHSLSPILGTGYDDMLWDRRGIYRAGDTDGVLYITSGIYYGTHLRAHGHNAIAIHPHVWAHPELASTWPLPRAFAMKLLYGSYSARSHQVEGFVQWITRSLRDSRVRRVYCDLPRDYPDLMGQDTRTHLLATRFLFRHFISHYLAPGLRANGIEVVTPTFLPWSIFRESQGPTSQADSPSRILELAGLNTVGKSTLLEATWNIVEPYQATVSAPAVQDGAQGEAPSTDEHADTMVNRLPKDSATRQEWNRLLGWLRPHGNAKGIRSIEDLARYVDHLTEGKWVDHDEIIVPGIDRPITPASALKAIFRRLKMVGESLPNLKHYLMECDKRLNEHVTKS